MAEQKVSSDGRHRRRTTTAEREHRIASPPAQKMIAKTRELISERGIAAANMRGIAHACRQSVAAPSWYFGSKGRLLLEVLRYEHDQRMRVLRAKVEPASTRAELVDAVQGTLEAFLDERRLRGAHELMAEVTRLGIDDEDVASRRGELRREYREILARLLEDKQQQGIVQLSAHATSVAAMLICLAQGFAVEITADRGWRPDEVIANARAVIEALLAEPAAIVA